MVFSSIIFIFYFLPLLLLLYSIAGRWQNYVLLFFSIVFYSWGEMRYTLVLLASIFISYCFGRLLKKTLKYSKVVLTVGITCNLLLLFYFKYVDFLINIINGAISSVSEPGTVPLLETRNVHLPLGISFFVFQAISYLVDVYRRDSSVEKNPFNVALYIAMFPQLVAGPIVRFNSIAKELYERTVSWNKLSSGIRIFIIGLAQKVLIANTIAVPVDTIYDLPLSQLTAPLAWFAATGYTLQIYFDFAGYSSMAIGLGLVFGFHFPENFNFPYFSQSITEFWRRWHMSLSRWFKDYLYIPLGGNRCGKWRMYFNLWIVFFLCGLWHGASWNFILWGACHGLFLVLERAGLLQVVARLPRLLRHVYTLFFIVVAWVPFRSETLEQSKEMLYVMFLGNDVPLFLQPIQMYLTNDVVLAFIIGILFSVPWWQAMQNKLPKTPVMTNYLTIKQIFNSASILLLFILSVFSLSSGAHNPFIYFKF